MSKTTKNAPLWKVTIGNRWDGNIFLFNTAEDAATFCEVAALNYSAVLADTCNRLNISMECLSAEEYANIKCVYDAEHAPQGE